MQRRSSTVFVNDSNKKSITYLYSVIDPCCRCRQRKLATRRALSDTFTLICLALFLSHQFTLDHSDMTPLFLSLRGTFDRFTALFRLLLLLEVCFATGTWTRSRSRRRARSTATPTAASGGCTVILYEIKSHLR